MAKKKTELEKNKERVKDEFDEIQASITLTNRDLSKHLASSDDLPDFGTVEIYDYESDLESAVSQSMEVMESIVDLYINDIPNLRDHKYIKYKTQEDAMVYAEAIFLNRMSRKALIEQMRQIDNGENSPRMHEVRNQTMAQSRENIKFLSNQKAVIEGFYKNLREEFGYGVGMGAGDQFTMAAEELEEKDNNGEILDNRQLNDMIKLAMMKKEEERNKRKAKKA